MIGINLIKVKRLRGIIALRSNCIINFPNQTWLYDHSENVFLNEKLS